MRLRFSASPRKWSVRKCFPWVSHGFLCGFFGSFTILIPPESFTSVCPRLDDGIIVGIDVLFPTIAEGVASALAPVIDELASTNDLRLCCGEDGLDGILELASSSERSCWALALFLCRKDKGSLSEEELEASSEGAAEVSSSERVTIGLLLLREKPFSSVLPVEVGRSRVGGTILLATGLLLSVACSLWSASSRAASFLRSASSLNFFRFWRRLCWAVRAFSTAFVCSCSYLLLNSTTSCGPKPLRLVFHFSKRSLLSLLRGSHLHLRH